MGDEESELADSFEEQSGEQGQSASHSSAPGRSKGESSHGPSDGPSDDAMTVSAHRSDDSYDQEVLAPFRAAAMQLVPDVPSKASPPAAKEEDESYEEEYEDDQEVSAGDTSAASPASKSAATSFNDTSRSLPTAAKDDRKISVTIIGVMGLRDADEGEGSDPYVYVEIEGRPGSFMSGTRLVTPAVENAMDLCWNFTGKLEGFHLGDSLVFTVMDSDEGGEDDPLGRAVLPADQLKAGETFSGELSLTGRGAGDGEPVLGIEVFVPAGVPRRGSAQEPAASALGSSKVELQEEQSYEDSYEDEGERSKSDVQLGASKSCDGSSDSHDKSKCSESSKPFIEKPKEPAEEQSYEDEDYDEDEASQSEAQASKTDGDTSQSGGTSSSQKQGSSDSHDKSKSSESSKPSIEKPKGPERSSMVCFKEEDAEGHEEGKADGKPIRRPSKDSTPHGSKADAFPAYEEDEDEDVGSRPRMGRTGTRTDHLGSDSEEESSGDENVPVAQPQLVPQQQERRPSAIRFMGALPPGADGDDGDATGGIVKENGTLVGTGWRRPSKLSTPRMDKSKPSPWIVVPAAPQEAARRPSLVKFAEAASEAADSSESAGHENTRRPSGDSTPLPYTADFGFGIADEDDEEGDGEEHVVIEDALDDPVGAQRFAAKPETSEAPGDEDDMDQFLAAGTQLQGPAGWALRRPMGQSASSPTLSSPGRRPRKHIKAAKATAKSSFNRKAQKWDERFQLSGEGGENEQKPKGLRTYFSRPASLPALREDFLQRGREADAKRLEDVDPHQEERVFKPIGPISADAEEPVIPSRHRLGGLPPGPDGSAPAPWNDRWSNGVALYNELLHPLHRAGFSQKSVFEVSPSQKWRRFNHIEVSTGVWRRAQTGQPRFPPLGV